MRTKLHLATVFLTGLCIGSISYNIVKNTYENNNSRIIAERNSQENFERYQRLLIKERNEKIARKIAEIKIEIKPELHVIGINQGFRITGDRSQQGRASVNVDRPGKKVILYLSANSPVNWQVNATEGTEITKVILAGTQRQNVIGINNNIPVERASYSHYGRRYITTPQSIYANNFPIFLRQIHENTGLEIASFQGANIANFDRPFQINNKQSDLILSSNYPFIAHPCDITRTTFKGLYRVDNSISFGYYSLTKGPDLNNFIPVNVSQITYSPINNKYYGIQNGRYLVEVDPYSGKTRQIAIQNRNLRYSYLNGITFDTKRNRLLIYDRELGGYLYSYSLNTRQWNQVKLNSTGFTSIVYHPEEDVIYAVNANNNLLRNRNYLTLYKINSNGAVIDVINFSDTALAGLPNYYNGYNLQLISSGKDLVLVWGAKNSNSNRYKIGSIEPRIYLIDPLTRQVKLTWKEPAENRNTIR